MFIYRQVCTVALQWPPLCKNYKDLFTSWLPDSYPFSFVSGDLLRAERKAPGSEYGELIEHHITNGTIVPVAITCSLLVRAMKVGSMFKSLSQTQPFYPFKMYKTNMLIINFVIQSIFRSREKAISWSMDFLGTRITLMVGWKRYELVWFIYEIAKLKKCKIYD